jgi:hypothetical protein
LKRRLVRIAMAFAAAATIGPAFASLAPLPSYFAESWAIVEATPLLRVVPTGKKTARLPLRTPEATAIASRAAWPALITTGEAKPAADDRPVLRAGLTAYASLGGDGAGILSDVTDDASSLPPARPGEPAYEDTALDDLITMPPSRPEVTEVEGTKVAMLGTPLAGMAIGNLVRMAATGPIGSGSCHVEKPFKVLAAGPGAMDLSPAATLNQRMAERIGLWAKEVEEAAQTHLGQKIEKIMVAGSYDCRTQNHRRRARLSEHSYANALDVAGFKLANGDTVTIRDDWRNSGRKSDFLKAVHSDTCRLFQVVLGPGSDGYHEEHLHMDLGHWKACR